MQNKMQQLMSAMYILDNKEIVRKAAGKDLDDLTRQIKEKNPKSEYYQGKYITNQPFIPDEIAEIKGLWDKAER